jgi:hypothetical protein
MSLSQFRLTLTIGRYAAAVSSAFVALACGTPGESDASDAAGLEQRVVLGQTSPKSYNAIVAIYYDPVTWGTGTLVGPNLVLTSKQLLFDSVLDYSDAVSTCSLSKEGQPVLRVRKPEHFLVMFGDRFPMTATARGTRIHASHDLDLCASNVALLEIDQEFPVDPLPLRLDGPPLEHERGLMIGWGLTDARLKSPEGAVPSLMGKRNQKELEVLARGPDPYSPENGDSISLPEDTFLTEAGACHGDEGAPFVSRDTGAIVGTVTRWERADPIAPLNWDVADCYGSHAVFGTLTRERDWLLEAFRDSGEVPWMEGFAKPGPVGETCADDRECLSGRCILAASGGFCSTRCEDTACEVGLECLSMDGQQWCVPEQVSTTSRELSSCTTSPSGSANRSSGPLALWALAFAGRRLRRRPTASTNRTPSKDAP